MYLAILNLCYETKHVEFVFLPQSTTSLIQLLHQGIIWFIKATHTHLGLFFYHI